VAEALRAGEEILEVHVAEGAKPRGTLGALLEDARRRGVAVKWMPAAALDRTFREAGVHGSHQGVVALLAEVRYHDVAEILALAILRDEPPFVLALDAIQDVHNLGSLIRTADAVGMHGVIIPDRRAARVTPAVRNASAGAVSHVRVARRDLAGALDELAGRDIAIVGLHAAAPCSAYEQNLTGPLCLVVGAEAQGLRKAVASRCDTLVHLPMLGHVDSLNAAVAGSVVAYEALRQRRAGPMEREDG
jgi:23S rRNA (guanosine2251-2'-O)-methyltransferase